MFCTKCGSKLMDGALFCTKCGNRVTQGVEGNSVSADKNKVIGVSVKALPKDGQPANTSQIRYEEPKQDMAKHEVKREKPQKEKKAESIGKKSAGKGRGLLITAIIMVFLLIVAVVLFILFGLSSESGLFSNGFFGKESSRIESGEDADENEEETDETGEEDIEAESENNEVEAEEVVEETSIDTKLADIQSKIEAEEYQEALVLIGEAKLAHADNENIYLYEADVYLKQKNYLSAIEVLEEGIAATSSDALFNRKKYISRNIVLVEATPQNGGAGFFHEYGVNGNLIREEIYNSAYEPGGWNEYTYDTTGAIAVRNTYNSQGNLEKRSEYRYDSAGMLEMVVDYNAKHVRQGWHEYVYDSLGREIEVVDHINEKKIGWKTKSEYDSYGRLFRNTGYDGKNKVTGWVETKYDGNGNVIMMIRYDNKGKTVEWNETKYDPNGNPTESINYSKNDTVTGSTKYEYDTNGKKTKEIYYDGNGIEIGYAEFDIAGKKKTEQNKETGVIWNYQYQYIGDVLSDVEITPVSGTLSFSASAGYKRIPSQGAAYVGRVSKNDTYRVIGEFADFYQVEEGWYFSKNDSGINFTP